LDRRVSDPNIPRHQAAPFEGIRYGVFERINGVVSLVDSRNQRWTLPSCSFCTPFGGGTEGLVKLPRLRERGPGGVVTVEGDTVIFMFRGNRKTNPVILGCAIRTDVRADLPYNHDRGDPDTLSLIVSPSSGRETKVVVDGAGLRVDGVVSLSGGEALVKRSLLERLLDCLPEMIAGYTAATGSPPAQLVALKLSLELDLGGGVGTYHTKTVVAS
jgi:hypothetical protein